MRLCFVIVILICSAGIAGAQTDEKPKCLELLQSNCQECHYLDRVCKQVGERSKRGWKKTFKRMIKKRGAEITDGDKSMLLDCLAAPAPDIKKECGK
jgi:hypothetical protein